MSDTNSSIPSLTTPSTLETLRRRADRLLDRRRFLESQQKRLNEDRAVHQAIQDLAEPVTLALEVLSQELFQKLLATVERNLTQALQEILEQPIQLKAETRFERNSTAVKFWIERNGFAEDIFRGQGGSVANILSIGLRMLAITTLDRQQHRRFLVLDEQDCWLQPQLVPRLVNIVKQAGTALGFQVVMISHHEVELFEQFADRIYEFIPQPDGSVLIEERSLQAQNPDVE